MSQGGWKVVSVSSDKPQTDPTQHPQSSEAFGASFGTNFLDCLGCIKILLFLLTGSFVGFPSVVQARLLSRCWRGRLKAVPSRLGLLGWVFDGFGYGVSFAGDIICSTPSKNLMGQWESLHRKESSVFGLAALDCDLIESTSCVTDRDSDVQG